MDFGTEAFVFAEALTVVGEQGNEPFRPARQPIDLGAPTVSFIVMVAGGRTAMIGGLWVWPGPTELYGNDAGTERNSVSTAAIYGGWSDVCAQWQTDRIVALEVDLVIGPAIASRIQSYLK